MAVLPRTLLTAMAAIAVTFGLASTPDLVRAASSETAIAVPSPKVAVKESGHRSVAIFAGGCFWGVEGVFAHVKGVTSAVSGYHGGTKATADYASVSSGRTGHAEAVRVVYDPAKVSYGDLLRIYFSVVADPTRLNGQGPDHGRQYRSAIVPMNKAQARMAQDYIAQLGRADIWKKPLVTKVEAYKAFYPAENYHQDFMIANPRNPYILRWDAPKVANLKSAFPGLYRSTAIAG